MRTFYIFKVNSEYYKLTKDYPFNLYSTYLNIKLGTKDNLNLLYNEYFSITDSFNKDIINKIIYYKFGKYDGYSKYQNIHSFNNYYTDEVSKLIIYNSFMVLKSNKENSLFLEVLNKIPNLFVIDFEVGDYFYLNSLKSVKIF